MCGIAGGVRFDGGPVFAPGVLERMTKVLRHRGPDDEAFHREGGAALGFRRLQILDLTPTGRQPMANADGSIRIVFNGEIYNHQELRRDLEGRGYRFRGRSDTESIVYGYEEKGTAIVKELRGMFALAVWDRRRRRLLLARDPVGKKPLYWWEGEGRLLFASEPKALLEDPAVPRVLDPRGLATYLTYGYVPAPRTIFRGIHKLEAGTWLEVAGPGARPRRYWELRFGEPDRASDRAARDRAREELAALLEEAVRIRLESDVPLGAFLSGGLDSSAVVSLMARLLDHPVVTASIGFEDAAFDELPQARAFARRVGAEIHDRVVRADALEALDRIAFHFDEPFADASAVPTWYVCQMARERVTVALSGDGGDEAFVGYRHYRFERLEHRLRHLLPEPLRRPVFGALAAAYPKADWLPRALRGKTLLKNLSLPPDAAFAHSSQRLKFLSLGDLLRPEIARELEGFDPGDSMRCLYREGGSDDPVRRAQHVDSRAWLPEDILVKVDRASMAHALEVRAPLLDPRILTFAARCPSSWWLRGGETKSLFREVIRPWVGDDTLRRPKQGFSPPLRRWLLEDLRPRVEEELLAADSRVTSWLDRDRLHGLWRSFAGGRRDLSDFFWSLVVLETWHRVWLDP